MRRTILFLLVAVTLIPTVAAADIEPGSLLVYYGWPSSINGTFSVPLAAAELGRYDMVVLGDGLSKSTHPDHQNTVDILADASMASTTVFGYVDLGVSTQNLPPSEVQIRVDEWKAMGADGIFFDDFGYDFGTTRARQNAAVQYAHAQGLPVVANAFVPADAFGAEIDPTNNPTGEPTALNDGDFYFYESHQIRLNQYESEAAWQAKAQALHALQEQVGFGVLSVTTSGVDDVNAYDQGQFLYAWYSALLYGHRATGWGEYGFSATGASNAQAPYRARPGIDAGTKYGGPVSTDGTRWTRQTNQGQIFVDTATHQGGFDAGTAADPTPLRFVRLQPPSPNPFNPHVTIAFSTPRVMEARLLVVDLAGRFVRCLATGPFPAGTHEVGWDGRDRAGADVASGVYFAVLEGPRIRRTAKMTLVR